MGRIFRGIATALVAFVAVASTSVSVPTAAQAASTRGRLTVTITGGKFPAEVRLVGPVKVSISKPGTKASARKSVRLKPGTYDVVVPESIYRAKRYDASGFPKTVTVKKGKTTKLKIRFGPAKPLAQLTVSKLTSSSIALAWRGPKSARYQLRRARGPAAPASANKGVKVAITKKTRITDSHLAAATSYSYALFVKVKKNWRRAATVTAGTQASAAPTAKPAAAYTLAPSARVVPANVERTKLVGGELWWQPEHGAAMPPLGAGVALADAASVPGGFLGTVAEISTDGAWARLQAAGLGDVFSYYDLNTVISNSPPVRPAALPNSSDRKTPATAKACHDSDDSGSLDATVDPVFHLGGRAKVALRSKWFVPYQVDFDVQASVTVGATVDISADLAASCKLALPEVMTTLTEAPVPLALRFKPEVSIGVDGKVEVKNIGLALTGGFWTKGSVGAHNTADGGLIKGVSAPHVQLIASGGAQFKIGGTLTIGPGAGNTKAGAIVGISGTYDPLTGEMSAVFPATDSRHDHCLKFDLGYDASVGIRAAGWLGNMSVDRTLTLAALKKDASYLSHPLYYPDNCVDDPDLNGGDFQATLSWGTYADLDLHVTDPNGEEIYYGSPTSSSGGDLDVDANPGCSDPTDHPIENIYWPRASAPVGAYHVNVAVYDQCEQTDLSWRLQIRVGGRIVLDEFGSGESPDYEIQVG